MGDCHGNMVSYKDYLILLERSQEKFDTITLDRHLIKEIKRAIIFELENDHIIIQNYASVGLFQKVLQSNEGDVDFWEFRANYENVSELLLFWFNKCRLKFDTNNTKFLDLAFTVAGLIRESCLLSGKIRNRLVQLTSKDLLTLMTDERLAMSTVVKFAQLMGDCIVDSNPLIRKMVMDECEELIVNLARLIPAHGDYQMQNFLMDLIMRFMTDRHIAEAREEFALRFFPGPLFNERARNVIMRSTFQMFEMCCRKFLNAVNGFTRKVISVPCLEVRLGRIPLIGKKAPASGASLIWLDFNLTSLTLTFSCELWAGYKPSTETTVTIAFGTIESVTIENLIFSLRLTSLPECLLKSNRQFLTSQKIDVHFTLPKGPHLLALESEIIHGIFKVLHKPNATLQNGAAVARETSDDWISEGNHGSGLKSSINCFQLDSQVMDVSLDNISVSTNGSNVRKLKEKLVKHNQETYRSKFKRPSQEDNLSTISENSIEDKRSSPEQEIIENSLSESSIGSERGNSPTEHKAGLLSTIDSHSLNEFIGSDCFSSSSDSVIDDTPKKIDHHVHATEARIYTGIDLVPNALINKTVKNDLSSNGPIIQKNIIAPSTCDPKNQNFISETPELDIESSSSDITSADATYAEPISPKIIPSKVPSELLPQCSTFEECEVVLTKMFASTPTPQLTNGKGVPKYATVEKSTGNAECTTPKFVCFDIVDTSKTVKNNVDFLQHNNSIDTPKMKATEEKNCDLEIKPKRANKFFKSKTPLENAPNTVISPLKKAKTTKNKDKPQRNVTKRKAPKAKNVDLGKSSPFKRSKNCTVSVRSASKRKLFTHADDSYLSVDESKYSKDVTPSNVYDIDAYSDSSEVFKPPKLTKVAGNITSSKEKSLPQDESLPSRRTRRQNTAKPSQTNKKVQKTAKNAGGRSMKNEAKKNTIDISSRINHLYFGDVETMRSAPFIQNRTANSPPTAINDCIQKDTEFNQLLSMTPLTMKPAPKKTIHKKNKIFPAETEDKELDFLILEPDRPPQLFDVLNSTGFSNFPSGDLNIAELNTSAIVTPPPQPNNLDISAEMVYTANRCESPILSLHGSFICIAEDTPYNTRSPSTADAHCERNQEVSSNLAVKKSSKISKRRTTIALESYKETPLPRTVSAADGIRSQRNEKAVDKEDCPYPAANQRNNNLSIIRARSPSAANARCEWNENRDTSPDLAVKKSTKISRRRATTELKSDEETPSLRHLSPPKGVQPDKKCSKISGRRATIAFERVMERSIVRTPPKTNEVFGRMDSYETSQSSSQSQRRITRSMTETNRTSSPYLLSQRPTMASQLVDFFPDNHELSRLSSSQLSGSDTPDVPPKKQTKRSKNVTIAESFRPLQSTDAKRTAKRRSTKDISEIPDEFRKSFMKTVERLLVKETIPKAMTITRKKLGL